MLVEKNAAVGSGVDADWMLDVRLQELVLAAAVALVVQIHL